MNKILKNLPEEQKNELKKKKQPEKIKVMLAKLTDDRFYKDDWIYERKLDGERCVISKRGKKVKLISRNNKKINASYPEIEKAAEKIKPENIILDGEIVAFENNISSFSKLQKRMNVKSRKKAKATGVTVYYYAFDIMYLDNYDLTKLPLITRKNILKKTIKFKDPLRFTRHRAKETKQFYNQACKKGWEGLMVKKKKSAYVHKRSSNWLKFKCVNEQEFVIGGYTEPHGERKKFGALLLGYYKNDKLKYAGKVGTGFDEQTLKQLGKKLKNKKIKKNPFDSDEMKGKETHFVKPELVCQIGFTEWTDHKLRHPRYLGLRRDKPAKKVIRENK